MKALVTGSSGFLGKAVVKALIDRGHDVHALVRPATDTTRLPWADRVSIHRADLRRPGDMSEALQGVDVVIHLAAAVGGSDELQMQSGVVGSENLFGEMARCHVKRLVLASSFSVYDWASPSGKLDEDCAMEAERLYERDGYAVAKVWQERVTRRFTDEHGWSTTILRPGFIWGKGNEWCAGAGIQGGRLFIVNGPLGRLPLTHVDNCADCFVTAAESQAAVGQTFNVVDDPGPRAWTFVGDYIKRSGTSATRLAVPYVAGMIGAKLAAAVFSRGLGPHWKLPGLFVPIKYCARFRSLYFDNSKVCERLNWSPPYSYRQCLDRTFGAIDGERPSHA